MKRITVDTVETSDQAIRYVRSNPCCICSYANSRTNKCYAGVKYRGTCKVARILRDELWKLRTSEERKEE
jgi:hypothetical protein